MKQENYELAMKLEELLNKMECAVLGITDGEGENGNDTVSN